MIKKITDYLEKNAVGAQNAIPVRKLGEALGFPNTGTNDDLLRETIRENDIGKIGTCNKGCFIIETENDLNIATTYLNSRVVKIIKRVDILKSHFNSKVKN